MDTENLQEKAANMEVVGCPFKKIKLDSVEKQLEHVSPLVTIEDSCINSNGGESGTASMPVASEFDIVDETAEVEGGFENGKSIKVIQRSSSANIFTHFRFRSD